ncbi:MAG: acireductone synthase, partial [Myxococcota bacterium]
MTTADERHAILLDIEGTTSSIRFVHEILFPYARTNLDTFLKERWADPDVQADL